MYRPGIALRGVRMAVGSAKVAVVVPVSAMAELGSSSSSKGSVVAAGVADDILSEDGYNRNTNTTIKKTTMIMLASPLTLGPARLPQHKLSEATGARLILRQSCC